MSLKSCFKNIAEVSEVQKLRMFELMEQTYNEVNFEKFKRDFDAKNYVLILSDESEIRGFTTLQVFDFQGKKIIYSGDTVISETSRGEIELMRAWWRFSYKIQCEFSRQDVFWLLISKGWRTYKFFPLFLKEFYPNKLNETPIEIKNFMDALCVEKFGANYKNGIVTPDEPDYLKNAQNDVPARKADDEDIKFFLRLNPGYIKGDELICLAKLHPDNLTKAGLRLLHGVRE